MEITAEQRLINYINYHQEHPQPFVWGGFDCTVFAFEALVEWRGQPLPPPKGYKGYRSREEAVQATKTIKPFRWFLAIARPTKVHLGQARTGDFIIQKVGGLYRWLVVVGAKAYAPHEGQGLTATLLSDLTQAKPSVSVWRVATCD